MEYEVQNGNYTISTDKRRLDLDVVHGFLATKTYWSKGCSLEVVQRSIDNSICFGIYEGRDQIGFARVITDEATMAYLSDVFVLEEHRGKGLSKWLVEVILADSRLQGLRRFVLVTQDAHSLYSRFGFECVENGRLYMEIFQPDVYAEEPDFA
jgi:N-acetylglutamate synthase-like GNAT family acetyltransferase